MIRLPAISLWQPHAIALLLPDLKVSETRSFRLPPRLIGKRTAIHAAKRRARPGEGWAEVDEAMEAKFGSRWQHALAYGAVIGTTTFTGCFATHEGPGPAHDMDSWFGDWSEDRFYWPSQDPEVFSDPIPWTGRQGWFEVEVPA